MKRFLSIFLFVSIALSNLMAQDVAETPLSYAFLMGEGSTPESTLKYKFSYQEEKYYINLRFIKGSDNAFIKGDKIIMETKAGKQLTCAVETEEQLEQGRTGYIPFETSILDVTSIKEGVKYLSLVREGKTYTLATNKYWDNCTEKNAQLIPQYAYTLKEISEKKKIRGNAIAEKKEYLDELRKLINEKRELNKEGKEVGLPPTHYSRMYIGYAPLTYHGFSYEGINVGYTGGIRLGKIMDRLYLQYGVQFDYTIDATAKAFEGILSTELVNEIEDFEKNETSFSFPIDFTYRYYLGKSNVALSPFVGGIFKINLRHSTEDGELLQPGLEFGLNLDYKHFYFGTLYHVEFFTRKGLGHTRGLSARIGFTF